MQARLLLAAIVFPAFTLAAQRPSGALPAGAAVAAALGTARLDRAQARPASIDGERSDVAPATSSGVRILERLRSAVFLGVLDDEATAADEMGLPAGRFNPYPRGGDAWTPYTESRGMVYPEKGASEKSDVQPGWRPAVGRWSGCWWMWVFTGVPVCS